MIRIANEFLHFQEYFDIQYLYIHKTLLKFQFELYGYEKNLFTMISTSTCNK